MKFLKIGAIMVLSALLIIPTLLPYDKGTHGESISVYTGDTEKLGGGSYVEMRYGNDSIGVIYGTSANPNGVIIYSTGESTLKEIEDYDGSRLVKKEVQSERTLFYMEIKGIVEFRDVNNNSVFDGKVDENGNYTLTSLDYPLNGVEFRTFSARQPLIIDNGTEKVMKISLDMGEPKSNLRWNDIKGRMEEVNGGKIADRISMDIIIRMNVMEGGVEIPVNDRRTAEENGHIVDVSARAYLNISGWGFQYPDSKLFVDTSEGFLSTGYGNISANISTSSPRYMDIDYSTKLSRIKPIYGHEIKFKLMDNVIGRMHGDPYVLVDRENRTYRMFLCNISSEDELLGNISYHGLHMETTSTLQKNYSKYVENASLSGDIEFKYSSIDGFSFTDATPKWSYIMPFEIAIITGAVLVYARKSHNR